MRIIQIIIGKILLLFTFSYKPVGFILSFDGKIYGYYRKMLVTLQPEKKGLSPRPPP